MYVASRAFIGSILPPRYKESITIALYKERKKDYSLLGSYQLITLENILVKLLEKVLVNYISYVVEEYKLLP